MVNPDKENTPRPLKRQEAAEFKLTASKGKWIMLLVLTLIAAGLLSPWASGSPDGLERVAEDHGFLDHAGSVNQWAPLSGYQLLGIPWTALRVGAAGLIGVCVMLLVLGFTVKRLARKKENTDEQQQ